jgi:hypothetical protein
LLDNQLIGILEEDSEDFNEEDDDEDEDEDAIIKMDEGDELLLEAAKLPLGEDDRMSDGSGPGMDMNGDESDHLSDNDGDIPEDKPRKKKKSISPMKKDKKEKAVDAKKKGGLAGQSNSGVP